jgi:coenzyme F420-reducing hydrogenase beta subunit
VSAVKKFIGETELLYTIDIVCHGVPSPEYWKKYIHSQKEPVLTYKFRDRKNRSKNKSTYYSTLHYSSRGEKRVPSSDDVYFSTYLKGINFRYSCYYCNYANTKREGDITVGDCDSWNYGENPYKSESRNFISINTPRGEELFENAKDDIEASPITVRDEVLVNRQLRHPSVKPHERDDFYVNVFSMPFSIFEKKYNKRSFMLVLKKIAAKIIE